MSRLGPLIKGGNSRLCDMRVVIRRNFTSTDAHLYVIYLILYENRGHLAERVSINHNKTLIKHVSRGSRAMVTPINTDVIYDKAGQLRGTEGDRGL